MHWAFFVYIGKYTFGFEKKRANVVSWAYPENFALCQNKKGRLR